MYENHKHKLLITSVLFLLLGLAFLFYPANSMIILVRLTGCFLIALGIMIFVPTIRQKEVLGMRFGLLLAMIIVIVVFGVILLVMPEAFVEVFWITMGIILILDGIKNLMFLTALPNKAITIILAIISIICGVLIIVNPFGTGLAFAILIGAFYTYSGAAGIFLHIFGKLKRKSGKDSVDGIPDEETIVDAEIVDGAEEDGEVKMIESNEVEVVKEAKAEEETKDADKKDA